MSSTMFGHLPRHRPRRFLVIDDVVDALWAACQTSPATSLDIDDVVDDVGPASHSTIPSDTVQRGVPQGGNSAGTALTKIVHDAS